MKHVHDTWYRLADGTQADPNDVITDEKGVLRHKNGVPVALRDNGVPHTIGVDAKLGGNVAAAAAGKQPPAQPTTVPAEQQPGEETLPAAAAEDAQKAAERPAEKVDGEAADAPEPAGKGYKNRKLKTA